MIYIYTQASSSSDGDRGGDETMTVGDAPPHEDDFTVLSQPPSGFVTKRGRRVKKGRLHRSPWVTYRPPKRQRVGAATAVSTDAVILVETRVEDRHTYDPTGMIPVDLEADFQRFMEGHGGFVNLEVVDGDQQFFTAILTKNSWLSGEVR
jgi:hypothetical protein